MTVYELGLIGATVSLVTIFEMLRRRKLREKYAVFWVILAMLIVVIAIFPGVLSSAADVTGVQVPSNLLFFVASLVLLAVNVQLSSEVGRLEDKVRTLAEEIGLLRLEQHSMERRAAEGRSPEPELVDRRGKENAERAGDGS